MQMPAPELPRPRGYVATAIITGLMAGIGFGVFYPIAMAVVQGKPILELLWPWGLVAGFHFGLAMGLVMGFVAKGDRLTMEFEDREDREEFVDRLDREILKLRYRPIFESDDFLTYKPTLRAGIAAGRISMRVYDDCVTIVGPKMYLKKLRQVMDKASA